MSLITIEGTVTADGQLHFERTLPLPPGRFQVTFTPISDQASQAPDQKRDRREEFWSNLRALREKYLGDRPPRTAEEALRDLEIQRQEWADRDDQIRQLQIESYERRKALTPGGRRSDRDQ